MSLRLSLLTPGLLALTLLSGCSILPERVAKATYTLPPPELATTSQVTLPLTLRVLTPQAESPLDGAQILVQSASRAMQAYGGIRWRTFTPILVRDHWIEGLRQSMGLRAVIGETSGAMSTLSLGSDLTHFEIQYHQGRPSVVIQLDVQLLESGSRQLLAVQRFRVQQIIDDEPVESVIAGFGLANQALTEQLVAWILRVSAQLYGGKDPARRLADKESSTTE